MDFLEFVSKLTGTTDQKNMLRIELNVPNGCGIGVACANYKKQDELLIDIDWVFKIQKPKAEMIEKLDTLIAEMQATRDFLQEVKVWRDVLPN